MGNCFSSSESSAAALRDLVQRPGEPDVILTADKITQGLNQVAQILKRGGRDITIITVGGAVNTLLLRSRPQTSDVDFFYSTKLRNENVSAVMQASKKVAKELQVGEGWLNNHTAIFITDAVKVFQAPGLRVLAAPWRYALAAKIDRLGKGGGAKDKDLSDAVVYLRELIHGPKRRRAVTEKEVSDWFAQFSFGTVSRSVLIELENAYHARYRETGIVLSG